ncbi:DNA polymerase-3 subunit gamma/tau [Frondihabitans sp. PhB188]|nr:DNA polymerase-3 subunit gamma/tau [Frondihabitans sp. PhB188]
MRSRVLQTIRFDQCQIAPVRGTRGRGPTPAASVGGSDYSFSVVTALYRRYRPENFAELIGQSQVTDPLRTALRTNRVNHAYLFSGPRGCGKTTSARILARCLNCAEGPTDTPCGVCPSCVELSRDGSGSLDVIEIDAASHNGVDDARDLRDRAIFAPARDRYKIFILDEAHMVTPQGFNALLKIVEEPPEHVKFIFATTEPDKVIGTIRSRTHHYPFRLVPPAQMLDYVQHLCETEGVQAAPGVLPLVVRAGGGSVRDTLSLLDQLIAGSEGDASGSVTVEYERAVALLGYTHASLLDAVVDALGAHDGSAAFASVDRVIQTGQDPRRFVEDLLERLRDLIVVGATNEGAGAVLRGITPEELEHLGRQAHAFGAAELSRSADVVNRALTDMTGATSPRLHLELMIARVLVPESDETGRGALARVERLERRVGVDQGGADHGVAGQGGAGQGAAAQAGGSSGGTAPSAMPPRGAAQGDAARGASPAASGASAAAPASSSPAAAADAWAAVAPGAPAAPPTQAPAAAPAPDEPVSSATTTPSAPSPAAPSTPSSTSSPAASSPPPAAPVGAVTLQQLRDSWPEVLEVVERDKLSAWMVAMTATVRDFADEVLTLTFPSVNDVEQFKRPAGASGEGVSEHLRRAIVQVLGVRVKYIARVERPDEGGSAAPAATMPAAPSPTAPEAVAGPAAPAAAPTPTPTVAAATAASSPAAGGHVPAPARPAPARPASASSAPTTGWDVAPIPQSAPPEADRPGPDELGPDEPGPDLPEHISTEPPGGVPPVDVEPPVDARPAAPASTPAASAAAPAATRSAAPAHSAPSAQSAPRTPAPSRGVPQNSRYGEAVVREILNAQFIHEETVAPRVTPQSGPPADGSS